MSTPNGPVCDRCKEFLPNGCGVVGFHFTHMMFCSPTCLEAFYAELRAELAGGRYSIEKYGRYWKVVDPKGELVAITVYKKGAIEVVRRLERKG